ncbi:MAG: MerC domain-containing protein [Aequorivita sp.]
MKNNYIDVIALSSSLICAIHCATIPLILSLSSLSSLHFLGNPYIEFTFIGMGLLFVSISLWPSYKKVHKQLKPMVYAAMGFAFIVLGRFNLNELWEISNMVIGATLVSLAHYLNWRLVRNKRNHNH